MFKFINKYLFSSVVKSIHDCKSISFKLLRHLFIVIINKIKYKQATGSDNMMPAYTCGRRTCN